MSAMCCPIRCGGLLPGKPLPDGSPGPSLYCAVIVKTLDAHTRAKTGINELLWE
jgi:2,3,4,5-tetrahydropyridine-2-carboxylate N-succinyltransferase